MILKDHSFPSSTICPLKVRLVVTNPAVPRGTVHIRILDPKQPLVVDFKLFYSIDKIAVVIVTYFSRRTRWMGSAYKVQRYLFGPTISGDCM